MHVPIALRGVTLLLKRRMPSRVRSDVLVQPEMCVVKGDPNWEGMREWGGCKGGEADSEREKS